AAVSSLVNQASNYLMANHNPKRMGSLHPNIAPYGEIFETSDHKLITFAIGSNRHFQKLCQFLEIPKLAENQDYKTVQNRVKNREKLFEELKPLVYHQKAEDILSNMRDLKIPCGEIKDLKAVFSTKRAKNLIKEEIIEGQKTKRVSGIAFERN